MKKVFALLSALVLFACGGEDIAGTWTQPVPGMESMVQGFVLNPDGTAVSVNMATLQYETWRRDGDALVMTGKSIGNGQTIEFTETFEIESLVDNTLVLKSDENIFTYTRVK